MESNNIKEHFSRFIFPFTFDESKTEQIINNLNNKTLFYKTDSRDTIKCWEHFDDKKVNEFFLPHFKRFITGNHADEYLFRWKMSKEALHFLFGFTRKPHSLKAESNKFSAIFSISDIDLYIFRSGIGILIFEMQVDELHEINELILFNYYLKYCSEYSAQINFISEEINVKKKEYLEKLKPDYDKLYLQEGLPDFFSKLQTYNISNNELKFSHQLSLTDLVESIVRFILGNNISFNRITGKRLIVYSYLLSRPLTESEMLNALHLLSRVNKESYQSSHLELDFEHERIHQTYENINFGVSLEGAAVIVEDNEHPFFEHFDNYVRDAYFLIYIVSLHNRLALLNYRDKIAQIMPTELSNDKINRKLLNKIRSLKNKSVSRYINSYFAQIANNTAYEEVYQFYNENFFYDSLNGEIRSKTIEMDEMVSLEIERKNNQMIGLITMLGFILAPLSVIIGLFSMNIQYNHEGQIVTLHLFDSWMWFFILAGSISFVSLIAIIVLYKRFKK